MRRIRPVARRPGVEPAEDRDVSKDGTRERPTPKNSQNFDTRPVSNVIYEDKGIYDNSRSPRSERLVATPTPSHRPPFREGTNPQAFAACGGIGACCGGGNMRCPGTFSGLSNKTVRCSDSAARA
jgi:hypothetical protein